jgi:PST family polysaccharide transporter
MLVVVIDGITAVRAGLLMRTFRQDQITIANVAGLVANAALAITLAIAGAGAAAFAGGMVAGSVVTGGLMVLYARLPFRFGFDRSVASRLMRFGLPLAASLGLEAIVLNADFIIVGHEAGATQLGYYLLAFNISSWALGILIASVRHVSVAGFSRLSEMGEESVSAGVHRSLPVLFMLIAPVGALTATLARPLVVSVYGRSWAPAAPVLVFLAILTVGRVLVSFIADILMSHGKTRAILLINIAWGLVLVPAVYLGVRLDGIRGVGIAHAVACPLVALPLSLLALRRVGVKLAPLVPAVARPALGAALSTVVAVAVTRVADVPLVELALGGILGLLVYGLVAVPGSTWRRWVVAAGSRVSSARRSAHAHVSDV